MLHTRYGWVAECGKQFGSGVHPAPTCDEWNTHAHLNDFEGRVGRPSVRAEIQRFLDDADDEGPVIAASEPVGNASRMPGRGLATSTPPYG
jgi:hypothetical protein